MKKLYEFLDPNETIADGDEWQISGAAKGGA